MTERQAINNLAVLKGELERVAGTREMFDEYYAFSALEAVKILIEMFDRPLKDLVKHE